MHQENLLPGRPFHGQALRLARSFRGLTLAQVAEAVATSTVYIHQIEVGARKPPRELAEALASAVGFESSFFESPINEEFLENDCQFRAPKRMTAGLRTRVLSHGTLFQQFVRYLESRVKLPTPTVPSIVGRTPEEIEQAAESVRRTHGLGLDRPITHLPRFLERMGVVVTRFEASGKMDAFSRPVPGARPVIVLNTEKNSTSRTRFDMAHELGHLVLHLGHQGFERQKEDDADSFASAFLLPRVGFLREFPAHAGLNWDLVWELKKRWRTSGAAIIRRAHDLGRLAPDAYRRAWKHYMYKRWHLGEPFEPVGDDPELVANALRLVFKKEQPADIARTLGWTLATFEEVVGVKAEPAPVQHDTTGKVIAFRRASS